MPVDTPDISTLLSSCPLGVHLHLHGLPLSVSIIYHCVTSSSKRSKVKQQSFLISIPHIWGLTGLSLVVLFQGLSYSTVRGWQGLGSSQRLLTGLLPGLGKSRVCSGMSGPPLPLQRSGARIARLLTCWLSAPVARVSDRSRVPFGTWRSRGRTSGALCWFEGSYEGPCSGGGQLHVTTWWEKCQRVCCPV